MKTHGLMDFRLILATSAALAVAGCSKSQDSSVTAGQPVQVGSGWRQIERPGVMEAGALPDQVFASLASSETDSVWQPKVSAGGTRGPSLKVYPKVAPAVVVVRCGQSYGTGFIVHKEGWILTNHHVIAGAPPDPQTGAGVVMIHLGQIKDGWMKLIDEPIPATVYRASLQKDLALLKLTRLPSEIKDLPTVRFADGVPPPGSDCIAIGHPKAGILWTVREGEVSGQAVWPKERSDVLLAALSATPDDRQKISQVLAHAPQRKVVISSCGLNPGDSGGPLVDGEGRLIAVSFAVPWNDVPGTNLDKFSYHVHLDEVKRFMIQRPNEPEVMVPDPYPVGRYYKAIDLDGDGKPDALVFGMSAQSPPTGALVKLKSDDSVKSLIASIVSPGAASKWHFEFAWQAIPLPRTFYDTHGGGTIDLVLTDINGDGKAESVLRLVDGKWKPEPAADRPMFDAAYFTDKALAKRFTDLKLEKGR